MRFGKFRDAGTEGGIEQGCEAQSFFEADDAVLHSEGVEADFEDGGDGCDHEDDQPGRMHAWPADQVDDGHDQRDGKYGQDEKMEGRIKARVIGKVLGGLVGHGEKLLWKVGTSSHVSGGTCRDGVSMDSLY